MICQLFSMSCLFCCSPLYKCRYNSPCCESCLIYHHNRLYIRFITYDHQRLYSQIYRDTPVTYVLSDIRDIRSPVIILSDIPSQATGILFAAKQLPMCAILFFFSLSGCSWRCFPCVFVSPLPRATVVGAANASLTG